MVIKYVKLFPDAKVVQRASPGAVGFDVHAYYVLDRITREKIADLPADVLPGQSLLIGTGIALAIPFPYDCMIRPRSGIASKNLVQLLNSPGTVDPDYRGDVGILLFNQGESAFRVEKGMRVAQLIFSKAEVPHFLEVSSVKALPPTIRDTGGFGSTGLGEITLGDEEYLDEQRKWDNYFMKAAIAASELSNCLRGAERDAKGKYSRDENGHYCGAVRRFGAVIVKNRNIIAQGFNYRLLECSEEDGCIRERENIATGKSNDEGCLHAEIVAIQNHGNSGGASLQDASICVNAEPCKMCAKVIVGCGISTVIVPKNVYPTNGLPLLMEAGIEVRHASLTAVAKKVAVTT
ncbi:MAG: dUTP diphosphatase [bacterium]|nr:dUTP diphosphatase [bacterium]